MAKFLSYKNKRYNITVTVLLIISVVITNSFIVFSPDEDSRSYFSNLTSTVTVAVPLAIAFVMVFRYKRSLKKQENNKPQLRSGQEGQDKVIPNYYDNNKVHLSICVFLVLWFVAHLIWTFQYQQSSDISIADILWFIGYGFFGYFLYSLYYHFFRKEHEPLVLILIAIVISTVLVLVLDTIVSILRLLSAQPVDFSILLVTLVYPILDAVLVFPAVLIFWAARRVSKRISSTTEQKEVLKAEEYKASSPAVSSIWLLLLSVAMILSAMGDTGFAYSTAYGPDTVQRDVWLWDTFYNASGLCLAAALIGYRNFFSFNRTDTLQH
jgi:positive regulator of sigma E activity